MISIRYHAHHRAFGWYATTSASLQSLLETFKSTEKNWQDIEPLVTVVEITTRDGGKRAKTGFFDLYGMETHPKSVGMPDKKEP